MKPARPDLAALRSRLRSWLVGYAAALLAVIVVSLFIGLVLGQVNLANVSMLYLLAVLATAVGFGRGPAIFASVGAFLIFDWFFVQPLHQFTVSDPEEWISLLFFLLTATVTGQLAAGQRQRAREAQQREREAVVLYDLVRLLSEGDPDEVLEGVAQRLRRELQVKAVAIELWQPSGLTTWESDGDSSALAGLRDARATARVLHRGAAASTNNHAAPGRWVRIVQPTRLPTPHEDVHLVPVRVSDRRVGALLLVGTSERFDPADDRLVSAAAAQIGLAHERARLRQEATEAEILRRTDELRAALLNAVSHDLRTPLATIMASAGSLRQQDVAWTDDERETFAQAIEEEADHLNHLVGNLLDLSRIEGGSLHPQKSWQDLDTVIDDTVDRLKLVSREHKLRIDVPHDLAPIWFDPVEIGEVVYNLIENATKYAPAGTDISLTAARSGQDVAIAVEDRGPGIPAQALPHLFDPFYRVTDRRPRPDGLGLGLAIVKGLVEAHGGRVWAENRAGGGARFTFTLPTDTAPAEAASAEMPRS
jgi:two-component system, OmpR family, sensor histidine kinase KdpD